MKYTCCIICLFILCAIAIKSRSAVFTGTLKTDTTRVLKEYGSDSILLSVRLQKMVSGCWKDIQYRQYSKNGQLEQDRSVSYAAGKSNTCDFMPYIEHNIRYQNKRKVEEWSLQAACDECDASPCDIKKRWNNRGKLVYSKLYGKCSFQPGNTNHK